MSGLGERIVAAARGYLGVPWRHLGRTRAGLDCIGLVLLAYRDCGIDLADQRYERGERGDAMLAHIADQGRELPLDPAQTGVLGAGTRDGDVLLFADALYVCHVGLRTTLWGQPAVLHAKVSRRKVYEEPLTGEIAGQLRTAYRHPALED